MVFGHTVRFAHITIHIFYASNTIKYDLLTLAVIREQFVSYENFATNPYIFVLLHKILHIVHINVNSYIIE